MVSYYTLFSIIISLLIISPLLLNKTKLSYKYRKYNHDTDLFYLNMFMIYFFEAILISIISGIFNIHYTWSL